MRNLWFKAIYARPILDGAKTFTDRATSPLRAGDVVGASVGPRPPFARLRIVRREEIRIADCAEPDRSENLALYPGLASFVRLHFEVIG